MNDYSYSKIKQEISQLSKHIVRICCEQGLKVSSAESCTGGMISAEITAVSGSSAVIELGVCSYSNRIKTEVLKVSEKTLSDYSEYSTNCAEEMALGVLKLSGADYAVSTTGVAGPTGGSEEHPVGEVCIAVCSAKTVYSKRFLFDGRVYDAVSIRDGIRLQAVRKGLMLLDLLIMKDCSGEDIQRGG